MKVLPQISESELEVMRVLWEVGQATSSQIVDRLTNTTEWKPKTIQTLITRLAAKGAIKSEKTDTKAFLYSPQVGQSEYRAHVSKSFLQRVYNGSLNLMIASFIKDHKLSRAEIDSLKKLLDEDV